MSLSDYQLGDLLAVEWNSEMAQRFPNANHHGCRQEEYPGTGHRWTPYNPPRCHGWHCNRCGAPTNSYGHHSCPDRVVP